MVSSGGGGSRSAVAGDHRGRGGGTHRAMKSRNDMTTAIADEYK